MESTILLHNWAKSVTFASTSTNGLLGYVHANELNSAKQMFLGLEVDCLYPQVDLGMVLPWPASALLNNLRCGLAVSMNHTQQEVWTWPPCFGD